MGFSLNNLDQALKTLTTSSDYPLPLPLVHVSIARWFSSITKTGKLKPRLCDVFGEKLIYFFYGGVFYRPENKPTRNATEIPIAFVFSPSILKRVLRYFPFDTGALAKGIFNPWNTSSMPFDRFKVNGDGKYILASQLVRSIFASNELYLRGEPDPDCMNRPDPFPQLYSFYSDDLSDQYVDHRQCIIECHFNKPIFLKQDLLWVGFPESMTHEFAKLCEWMKPSIPQYYPYESHKIKNPAEIAAKLEEIAKQEIIKRYIELP